mgnify:FL=1
MYKYKSTCRFPMLIDTGSVIMEIRPQQTIEIPTPITYPNLVWLNPPKPEKKVTKKIKKEKPKEVKHGNDRQASGT